MDMKGIVESAIRVALFKGGSVGQDDSNQSFCDGWDDLKDELQSLSSDAKGFTRLFLKGIILAGDEYCDNKASAG